MVEINIDSIVEDEIATAISLAQREKDVASKIPFDYLKNDALHSMLSQIAEAYATHQKDSAFVNISLQAIAKTFLTAYTDLLGFLWNATPHDYMLQEKKEIAKGLAVFYADETKSVIGKDYAEEIRLSRQTLILAKEIGQKRLPLETITADNVKSFLSERYHARFPATAPALTGSPRGNPATSYGTEMPADVTTARKPHGPLLPFASG